MPLFSKKVLSLSVFTLFNCKVIYKICDTELTIVMYNDLEIGFCKSIIFIGNCFHYTAACFGRINRAGSKEAGNKLQGKLWGDDKLVFV